MKDVPEGFEFRLCTGANAKNIKELVGHIKELSPDEYAHHVNGAKNDFHTWVNDHISAEVAADIKNVLAQREMIEKLTGHHWEHNHKQKFSY